MSRRLHTDRRPRWVWLLAALALLVAGSLGAAHRAAHGGAHAGLHGLTQARTHGPAHELTHTARSVTGLAAQADHAHGDSCFAQHDEGSEQCRLLDQLLHFDTLVAKSWLAGPPRDAVLQNARPCALHATAAPHAYLARAPPLI